MLRLGVEFEPVDVSCVGRGAHDVRHRFRDRDLDLHPAFATPQNTPSKTARRIRLRRSTMKSLWYRNHPSLAPTALQMD